MKEINNKKRFNIICLILIIITIMNFILPNYVIAANDDEDTTFGGKLFKPISKLVVAMADGVLMGLQKIFTGTGDIVSGKSPSEIEEKDYSIRYSPAIIFSNMVPGLDANFINPSDQDLDVVKVETKWKTLKDYSLNQDSDLEELEDDYGFVPSEHEPRVVETDGEAYLWIFQLNGHNESFVYEWSYNGKDYSLINTQAGDMDFWRSSTWGIIDNLAQWTWDHIEQLCGWGWTLSVKETKVTPVLNDDGTPKTITSSAKTLQPSIAKWYKGLRLVAIVGLLSVLVYVGIRIILSATGQDKAKYKKMMTDWVAAMCILFILQFLMSFIITMTAEIINVFPSAIEQKKIVDSTTGASTTVNEDTLMTGIRKKLPTGNDAHGSKQTFFNIFAETVIYVALVVLTVMFTIQYLKRMIYLAFLTMISPLIALTYPLDKIKDRTGTGIYVVD